MHQVMCDPNKLDTIQRKALTESLESASPAMIKHTARIEQCHHRLLSMGSECSVSTLSLTSAWLWFTLELDSEQRKVW